MPRADPKRPRFGVFAEGPDLTDPDLPMFQTLWRELCARCGYADDVRVYGFTKLQIELLAEAPGLKIYGREPLDIFIARMHKRDRFENVIVAFDRMPPVKALKKLFGIEKPCLREEVNFILNTFRSRGHLPEPFLGEAARLLESYANNPRTPRGPGRPPRGPLDFIYMAPEFEGLFVYDEVSVRNALGLDRTPKDWPKFNPNSSDPVTEILQPAIDAAAAQKRQHFPKFRSKKHEWALRFIRAAGSQDRLWTHEITERLKTIVA